MIPESEYYRHSGKFDVAGAVTSLAIGAVVAYLLGWLYVYVTNALGELAFIATFFSAVIVGAVVGGRLTVAKARNLRLAGALGAVAGLLAVYFDWAIWAHMMLARVDQQVSSFAFIASPRRMWEVIQAVNEFGAWSYRGLNPKGASLWAVWGIEAAIIIVSSAWASYSMNSEDPFCENCEEWTKVEKDVIWTAMLDEGTMDRVLAGKNWDELAKHPVPDDGPELRIDLHICPKCKAFQTLLARRVEWKKKNRQGKREKKEKTVIPHLLISTGDVERIRKAAKVLDDLEEAADAAGDDTDEKSNAATSHQ